MFAILFIVLIVMICTVNVQPIGPEGTSIGLASLNKAFHDAFYESELWYKISELFGYLSLAIAGAFVIAGGCQMIKRKSLFKVDGKLIALGGLYAVMVFLYSFFEVIVVNYRPVIMAGAEHVEASFPSSHTMLTCVIMGGAFVLIGGYIKSRGIKIALQSIAIAVAAITVIGRLLSGVHWFTDILGGVFISLCLVNLYAAVCDLIESKKE